MRFVVISRNQRSTRLSHEELEHKMFSFISMNWRGKPLTTHRVIVELIAATTTQTGLGVEADLDYGHCPLKQKVTNAELAAVPFTGHNWHPDWNYTITPNSP
jgi:hypothetical protein